MDKSNRMAEEFLALLTIDSMSLHEDKMAEALKLKLSALGLDVVQDNAGTMCGSSAGNLIASMSGDPAMNSVMLSAHMDTVPPGEEKKPVYEGGYFHSDGSTVLGADNIAAVEIILETIRRLKEGGRRHGGITAVFTVAEELYAAGARHMDFSGLNPDYIFVLDCPGDVGLAAARAPAHCNIDFVIRGVSAHAGIDPEKGVNALSMMAQAVSGLQLGRIDKETTANIGIVSGGNARNIVPDCISLKGEIRSFSEVKIEEEYRSMCRSFERAAQACGGRYEARIEKNFDALTVYQDDDIAMRFAAAAKSCGIAHRFIDTCGGSDANIYAATGRPVLNIGIGMENMHTVKEKISLANMEKSVRLLIELICSHNF